MSRRLAATAAAISMVVGLQAASLCLARPDITRNPQCRWEAGFWSRDLDRDPTALVVFDDGAGPALYAAGRFRRANGRLVDGCARWDGVEWTALGDPTGTWGSGGAFALTVFDDGNGPALYAGGVSVDAQGIGRPIVARYDGATWTEIGTLSYPTPHTQVSALAVYDDGSGEALYASGGFDTADGVPVNFIAKWHGNAWQPLSGSLGTGLEQPASALEVYDDGSGEALYVGGWFGVAGGIVVNGIARWDGAVWSALSGASGTGVDNNVSALEVFDDGTGPALFVGGTFFEAGGVPSFQIARWDGSTWSALAGPSGIGIIGGLSWVYSLTVFDDGTGAKLYAGGEFTIAGGIDAANIAAWDGTRWWALDGPSGNGTSDVVQALAAYDDGGGARLYAGGDFDLAGGLPAGKIARWDGSSWSPLSAAAGNGLGSSAAALETIDWSGGPELVAGGYFQSAGETPAIRIAAWDGGAWSALEGPSGNGIEGSIAVWVSALQAYDDGYGPALYAAGSFHSAGGLVINDNIARYKGGQWEILDGSSSQWHGSAIDSLGVFNDGNGPALFAGGRFSEIGGVSANRIAKWNGAHWSALIGPTGEGVDARANALAVFDDGSEPALYIGGSFDTAGGVVVNKIARWDGSAWSALTGSSGTGTDASVHALAVFDDGGGADLYVGGYFDTAGGMAANGVARWDGVSWTPVGGPAGIGVDGDVWAMTVWDDGSGPALYVSGLFDSAGGVPARNIARWDGSSWSALDGPAEDGIDWAALALHGFDDGHGPALAVAGYFNSAGGLASDGLAIWRCPDSLVFWDGFELGDLSAWTSAVP